MKIFRALGASAGFVVVMLAIHYVHMRFGRVNVLLYSTVFDAVVAAVVTGVVLHFARPFQAFTGLEKGLLVAVWLLAGYAFAITVPTIIDRSLSFYILEKLQQRGGGIRRDAFEKVFTEEYVKEHRLVDIRLTEQQQSGTIRIVNGCVELTEWGQDLATFSRFYRKHLLPTKRLIAGRYTDDLTDPFRHSAPAPDYLCH